MKSLGLVLGMSLVTMGTTMALAQEAADQNATTTINKSDVVPTEQQVKDIDAEITNARMRATLGSKSRFSFKSSLGYSGGSLKDPGNRIRPAYRAGTTAEALANISGSIGMNYRVNERDSLSFSTGVTVINPFHSRDSGVNESKVIDPRRRTNGRELDRYQIATPSIDWSRAYKAGGMQMVTEAGYAHATSSDSVNDYNAIGSISFGQTVLADFGDSNWSGGVAATVYFTGYRGERSQVAKDKGWAQDDYGYGLYPFAEYTFNDRYSFRTVFGYFENVHYRPGQGENDTDLLAAGAVESQTPYQSVGIGISITRDIYLYPNIQFTPLDIRDDRTNVALSTNINLF